MRRLAAIALLAAVLSGCSLTSLPSQQRPECSWDSVVPSNHAALCSTTFHLLATVTQAEVTGNTRAIRRVVTRQRVAHRILQYGRVQRAAGLSALHVVPSLTLTDDGGGKIGAGFYIRGKNSSGGFSTPETLYLRVRGSHAVITDDQPNQEW